MTLADHPMELLRPGLGDGFATSRELASITGGRRVQVGGMVVARQRPGTAKGVVFMLLEDELGMINLIVPPPVARRYRLVLRSAGFVAAAGKLEHREGTTNVLVSRLTALEPGDGAEGAPRRKGEHGLPEGRAPAGSTPSQDGSDRAVEQPGATVPGLHGPPSRVRAAALAELASALPARQSFGRRAR